MEYIGLILFVFLELLTWLILLRIILSWIGLLGIYIEISFISKIVDPMFDKIASILPVRFMGLDLSPLVILFSIRVVQALLLTIFPEIQIYTHTFF